MKRPYAHRQRITLSGKFSYWGALYLARICSVLRQISRIAMVGIYSVKRFSPAGNEINGPQRKNAQIAVKYDLSHKKTGLKPPENRKQCLYKTGSLRGEAFPHRGYSYQNIVHYMQRPFYPTKCSLTSLKKNVYAGSITLKPEITQNLPSYRQKPAITCPLAHFSLALIGSNLAATDTGKAKYA